MKSLLKKLLLKKSLLSVSLLFLCLASFAQGQVFVTGRVINETTGEPVPGLSVFLLDELGQRLSPEDLTTLEGEFTIGNALPDAWYTIEVYSGDILRFTDYVFVDSSAELGDITVVY